MTSPNSTESHSPIRIGDRERIATLDHLTRAQHDGRLTFPEFDERSELVVLARTRADLERLVYDLPQLSAPTSTTPIRPREANRANAIAVRSAAAMCATVTVICLTVWVAVSAGVGSVTYFWPIWPMIGTAIPVLLAVLGKNTSCGRLPLQQRRQPR